MFEVGVVGGTGYTGVELLRLLARHPGVHLRAITSRSEAGKPVTDLFPSLRGRLDLRFEDLALDVLAGLDLVFFATPHGVAMNFVPELLERGVRVVDLAADFRLRDADEWAHWYGQPHACPELLDEAVYGLPEIHAERISRARLVANPGCYPTSIVLGWLPLVERGLVDAQQLIADAKSGATGAGRQAQQRLLFAEIQESFSAYGVLGHRHEPEIAQMLRQLGGSPVDLVFTPHLVPMSRGIHATLYARLIGETDVQQIYEQRYAEAPFVAVLPPGSFPRTADVRGSNACHVAVHRRGDRVIVLSVIDNLVKGAAGQAVHNMNLMLGLPELSGLEQVALCP